MPTSNQYNYSPNKAPVVLNQPHRHYNNNNNSEQGVVQSDQNEIRKLLDENKNIRKTIEEKTKFSSGTNNTTQGHVPGTNNNLYKRKIN